MRPILPTPDNVAGPDLLAPAWQLPNRLSEAQPPPGPTDRVPLAPVSEDAVTVFSRLARWYARYRPAYPTDMVAHLAAVARLGPTSRVLDLGCGPGRLAIALAPMVGEVVGIDPAEGMIAQASRQAAREGVGHRICWRVAGAEDLTAAGPGPFDLVVIASAAAFMDLDQVMTDLAPKMAPGSTVAIADATPHLQPPRPPWQLAADRVRARWFAPAPARPEWRSRLELAKLWERAGFAPGVGVFFHQRLILGIDEAVGVQYSWASCDPHRLGGDWPDFENELRTALLRSTPDGRFHLWQRTDLHLAVYTGDPTDDR